MRHARPARPMMLSLQRVIISTNALALPFVDVHRGQQDMVPASNLGFPDVTQGKQRTRKLVRKGRRSEFAPRWRGWPTFPSRPRGAPRGTPQACTPPRMISQSLARPFSLGPYFPAELIRNMMGLRSDHHSACFGPTTLAQASGCLVKLLSTSMGRAPPSVSRSRSMKLINASRTSAYAMSLMANSDLWRRYQ